MQGMDGIYIIFASTIFLNFKVIFGRQFVCSKKCLCSDELTAALAERHAAKIQEEHAAASK